MQIPQSNILTTRYLNRVFDKTVATYKYYWFLGILDLCVKHGKTRMNVWEIMITMVANAWYPVIYFRLSFGKSESLYETIWALQKEYNIPINISIRDLTDLLHELIQRADVRKRLNFPMQLFRKSRQTLVFNKFKTCLKNSDTRKIQYYSI